MKAWIAGAAVVIAGAMWLAFYFLTDRPPLRVELVRVTGYTDAVTIWMPFRVTLAFTNLTDELLTVRQVHVAPDLEGFNEAYSFATPPELESPLGMAAGGNSSYEAAITLLNANQLQEQTFRTTFRVRIETDRGDVSQDFPAELAYVRDPKRRQLRLLSPPR